MQFATSATATLSSWGYDTSADPTQTILQIANAGMQYDEAGRITGYDAGSITTADIGGALVTTMASHYSISESDMNYGSDFATVFGQEYARTMHNNVIGAASGWANRQLGSENRLIQQFGVQTALMGYSAVKGLFDSDPSPEALERRASREANENDQNRRTAGFFQGWQFWRDEEGGAKASQSSWLDASFDPGKIPGVGKAEQALKALYNRFMGENEPDPVEVAQNLPGILWKAGKKWLGDRWDDIKDWFSRRYSEGKELVGQVGQVMRLGRSFADELDSVEYLALVNRDSEAANNTSSSESNRTSFISRATPLARLIDPAASLGDFFEGFTADATWSEVAWTLGLLPVAYLKHVVFNTAKLFGGALLQDYSVLDFTWGLPATTLGLALGTVNVIFGADVEIHKSGVLKLDGAPIATPAGFSLGPVLTSGSKGFSKYAHEAGHSMQNRMLGPAYLGVVIWSLSSGIGASVLGDLFGLDWWTWDDHADLRIEKWADDLDGVYNEKHSWL